jgi:hypothetical protein
VVALLRRHLGVPVADAQQEPFRLVHVAGAVGTQG